VILFTDRISISKRKTTLRECTVSKRRKKLSEYGTQLQEKQKAKYTYGILEKQFKKYFHKASRKKGITGEVLLQMIETRLDNIVYRLGIAPSRSAARQLVSHRHITVKTEVLLIFLLTKLR
jgi:small subunit ribosomal protein S4